MLIECAGTSPKPLEKEVKYSSFGKEAFTQKFILPDGSVAEYFLFGVKGIPIIVLPITENNEVVAIEEFRYGANKWILELPGGLMNDGETPISAAARELEEETGYNSSAMSLIASGLWFEPACFRVTYDAVVALNCKKNSLIVLDKEELINGIHLIPVNQWLQMIDEGKITDSKSIAVTLLAHLKGLV